ncbi:YggT family protein, partial [Hydrogenimonas sp.]
MILSTFVQAFAQILHMVISIYIWVVIIAALVSWVRPDPYNPIVQTLYRLTEPVY